MSYREAREPIDFQALLESPLLGLVEELDLRGTHVTPEELRHLAASPSLGRLRFLDLRDTSHASFVSDPPSLFARHPRLLQLEFLGGQAPVQGSGFVGPHPFYFRARHEHWTFGLSECSEVYPVDVYVTTDRQFAVEQEYGGHFSASYMPEDEALAAIRRSVQEYLQLRGIPN